MEFVQRHACGKSAKRATLSNGAAWKQVKQLARAFLAKKKTAERMCGQYSFEDSFSKLALSGTSLRFDRRLIPKETKEGKWNFGWFV